MRPHLVKKIALVMSCLALILTPGCAKRSFESERTPVTIAFQAWVGYGPFYLAQEKGFFEEEGVELIIVDEQLDSARRDAFKHGMLDCEAGTLDLLVSKGVQDTPIVAVMEIDESFGSDAVIADRTISSLEDLKGKSVVIVRDDVGETFLSALFAEIGLSFNDINLVPARPEKVAETFLHGSAEACVTWEPQVSEALKKPGAHILTSSKEHAGLIIDTLNVRRDLVENDPALVKKIMRAWFKGLKYYRDHPLEASEIIAKYFSLTPEQYRKSVEGLRWEDYEAQRDSEEFRQWLKSFDAISDTKHTYGRIAYKPEAAAFLNHSLLEDLYEDRR